MLYDYFSFGGLQEDCRAAALACAERGHEVHVFCRTWQGEQPHTIEVHTLGTTGWSNTSRNQHFLTQLQGVLPQFKLDGIVAFNRMPNADIYFAADPCFVERHKGTVFWKKWLPRYRNYASLEASIFNSNNAPQTLVLTTREIEAFTQHYNISKDQFHLLPPGVKRITADAEMQATNRSDLRSELGVSEDATIALFVGSGFRVKGLDRALHAMRANQSTTNPIELWVVGNDNSSRFQKLANQTGVTIRFLGGRHDVERFYDAADFLLHPAYSESAGKVLLEALTHGLPVLTTDTCGYASFIEEARAGCVLLSPFSQDTLNETLKTFITETDTRREWSENGKQYASTHDLYSCHSKAADMIEQLLPRT